ncbi:MAG: hypothetical protein ACLP4V_30255 [Methylocella sp.]
MRFWLSGSRILYGLVRPDVSFGWEDFRPRWQAMAALPPYRRYELRHGLQEAAKASGKPIGKDEADYFIDKALATGAIDSNGDLVFHIRGTREEIVGRMMASARAWNMPMSRAEAERRTDAAIAASTRPQRVGWFLIGAFWVVVVTVMIASLWR